MLKKNLKIAEYKTKCATAFNSKLSEKKFNCYFSMYLYLRLKKSISDKYQSYIVSSPIEMNISEISREAKVSRNTCRKAYRELLNLGLLIKNDEVNSDKNSFNSVILVNDKFISGWSNDEEAINFKFNVKSNNA